MFNLLVSADGNDWETAGIRTMPLGRFNEYSGAEAEFVNANNPESLAALEKVDALLMYETGATGPQVDVVRLGRLRDIRTGRNKVTFRFREAARLSRTIIETHADLLNIEGFEFTRTHWAIKDGTIPTDVRNQTAATPERYDIALSFAGEDREYVDKVAQYLTANDIAVFYDRFEEVDLWGKDLAEHFDWVYRTGAQYCVMFISKHYAEKMWAHHERRAALAAAVQARREYILPVRFDATELPGIRPTIGYINLMHKSPEELGVLIIRKLGR